MSNATTDILAALNGYEGDNIWEDLIWSLPVDEAATEAADPAYQSDVVVLTDGRTFTARTGGRGWMVA